MKYRRNLAVAAITAAVVTTALVGTTLPDLVADRATEAVEHRDTDQNLSDSVVITELPETPSAQEISAAKESQQAREQMIVDIAGRIDQASQRANELEADLQRQQAQAVARLQEAEEAAAAAEEARSIQAAAASEDYQQQDTSAADVLLSDGDVLAEDATDQQLQEQAEQDAVAAEQAEREAEELAAQAQREAESAQQAVASVEQSTDQTIENVEELGQNIYEQLAALKELEGFDGSLQEFFEMMLGEARSGSSAYFTEDGDVDYQQLVYRVQQLRAEAEQAAVAEEDAEQSPAEAEPETAESSSEGAEGEAAPSEEPEAPEPTASAEPTPSATPTPTPSATPTPTPTPSATVASFDSLSSERQQLLSKGAELESGFSGGARDYYALVLTNSALTTSGGGADWDAVSAHVRYLEAESTPAPSATPTPSTTPTPSPSTTAPSPSASATPTPTRTTTPTPSPTRTQAPAPAPTPSIPGYDALSSSLKDLLRKGAELEPGFSGGAQDYYRAVLNNPALRNGDGTASLQKLTWHVNYLEQQHQPAPAPTRTQSQAPAAPAPTRTQAPAPTATQSQAPAAVPAGNTGSAQMAINWAMNVAGRSGTYYQLGGNGPDGWDCSSFVQAAFATAGINLPRTTYGQINAGRAVPYSQKQPGDLIFWGDYHVAIYLGNGRIVDAGSPSSGISVRSIFGSPNATVRRVF